MSLNGLLSIAIQSIRPVVDSYVTYAEHSIRLASIPTHQSLKISQQTRYLGQGALILPIKLQSQAPEEAPEFLVCETSFRTVATRSNSLLSSPSMLLLLFKEH